LQRARAVGDDRPVKARVVIVDDEPRMAAVVAMALGRDGYDCEPCPSAAAALEAVAARGADVVVTDLKMPDMDGIELLRCLHAARPALPVIMLTAHGSVPTAVAAMREGAFDYVTKPFDNDELRALVGRAIELTRLERENRELRREVVGRYSPDAIVAESPRSAALLALVQRVAPSRATVLLQGESGTGKELVARLLHYWSDRVGKPFVAVNCKAFAEGVLESELFGHERGAFTGAATARAGCFERAAGGTLFLDEIGEIGQDFQAKLLRVLQEGELLRVGGSAPRSVDVRVVCATNRNLRDEVAAGRFREDLFFRLNVIPVQLAPLRERREDILPLAHQFLERQQRETGRALRLGAEASAAILAHPWPGNVRELENALERAVVLARGEEITLEDLLLEQLPAPAASAPAALGEGTLQDCLDSAAAARIRAALASAGGNRVEAARCLGIERTTLYRMMKRLGL
jgi:DNA-binding NtrC family response regulator